jgi:hypothetical protein
MTAKSKLYLHITADDEPNIGVMELASKSQPDLNLLKTILEEHFDVECKIVEIKQNQFGEHKWVCNVIVDTEEHNKPTHNVWLERTFVYPLNYS